MLPFAPASGHNGVTRHFHVWSGQLISKSVDTAERRVQSSPRAVFTSAVLARTRPARARITVRSACCDVSPGTATADRFAPSAPTSAHPADLENACGARAGLRLQILQRQSSYCLF